MIENTKWRPQMKIVVHPYLVGHLSRLTTLLRKHQIPMIIYMAITQQLGHLCFLNIGQNFTLSFTLYM